jgi:ubiquinone/menaquinone biosynthesis C-methylase UbiE
MATTIESRAEYVLGYTSAEYERLNLQAQGWEPVTSQAIAQAGLRSGMSALDIGCGTGAAMQLLGQVVGPTGSVTGVDIDPRLGSLTIERLRSQGPEIYRVVEADFMSADDFKGDNSFDLVFARLLLFHIPNPALALSRMWNWVKPGGTLLILDLDMSSQRLFSGFSEVDKAVKLVREIMAASGKDVEIGSRMPEHFESSGIGTPDACEVHSAVSKTLAGYGMTRQTLRSLRQAAISCGIADGAALDELDKTLSELPSKGFVRWPDMVATRKRKAE